MVAVVGSKRHAGADHLVIRQPDRTLMLLPVWMTAPAAASHQLVSPPRLSIESLAEVRALVDALLASSGRESSPAAREPVMRSERHSQRDLFEERATVLHLRPDLQAKLTPLLQILLTEAAGVGQQDETARAGAQEDGDD
jgi:hypothetical protein